MRRTLNLPTMLSATHGALARWVRLAGAAALTLAVFGLELWLRVPVRPVLNQFLASRRPAPAERQDSLVCRLWATA